MCNAITKLLIFFRLPEDRTLKDAVGGLPLYSQESFLEHGPGAWSGDIVFSCPVAPKVADGDMEEALALHFPALLNLKRFYEAQFELQIAVGHPAPKNFIMTSSTIAMIAALQTEVICTISDSERHIEI